MFTVTTTSTNSPYILWNGGITTSTTTNLYPVPAIYTSQLNDPFKLPDHEYAPAPGFKDCFACPVGSPYACDGASHPYVIREWELG